MIEPRDLSSAFLPLNADSALCSPPVKARVPRAVRHVRASVRPADRTRACYGPINKAIDGSRPFFPLAASRQELPIDARRVIMEIYVPPRERRPGQACQSFAHTVGAQSLPLGVMRLKKEMHIIPINYIELIKNVSIFSSERADEADEV